MLLNTIFKNLFFFIFLYLFSFPMFSYSHINLVQTQIVVANTPKLNSTNLPMHNFAYELQLPLEEKSDSPTQSTVPPGESKQIIFSRRDENNNTATLEVTDPVIGGLVIWRGNIVYDPNSKQLTYQEMQKSTRYYITITTSITEKNLIPQFKIEIWCY